MGLGPELHTVQRPGKVHCSSLLSKQAKGADKDHTITHTYQKPPLIPPAGNAGTVWKASFRQNPDLGSLTERAREDHAMSAQELLYGAVSSFWQTRTTQGQCPGARPGSGTALPCFTLLRAGHTSEEEQEAYWRPSQTLLTLNQPENISTVQ